MDICPHCGGNRITDIDSVITCVFCGTTFPNESIAPQTEITATKNETWDLLAVWTWMLYLTSCTVSVLAASNQSLLPLQSILLSVSILSLVLFIMKVKKVGIVEAFMLCSNSLTLVYCLMRMGAIARGM